MLKRLLFLLSALCLFLQPLLTGQANPYETQVVERIDVRFVNAPSTAQLDTGSIVARMKTKTGKLFSLAEFDEDLKALARDYEDVDPQVETIGGKLHINLAISLKPSIRTIQWNGNTSVRTSKLQKQLGISPGETFDRTAFNKSFFEIKKYYVRNGFFEVDLDYDLCYDNTTNEIDIQIEVCEGRSGLIHKVIFEGFTAEERSDLEAKMVSQPFNFFYKFFGDCGVYSEDHMQQDQYVITNYLQNKGYADVKVTITPRDKRLGSSRRIDLIIEVEKGDTYHFGDITIEGNKLFSEEELRQCMPARSGEVFSPEQLHETVSTIKDMYGNKGYIDAIVEFEPTLDPDEPIYHVNIFIEESELYYVGLVRVVGNWSTQSRVILHECPLTPGEVLNLSKLKSTERRLRNIGYFKTCNVYAVRPDESSCFGEQYRDVIIDVEESSTGSFSAFLGASSLENIFGGLSVTEKNFNAGGLVNVWNQGLGALRGGGEYAYFSTTLGAKSRKFMFSWAKPYFNDTPWIVGFDVDRSTIGYVSENYYLDSWGVRFYAKYPFNAFMRGGWHYRIRNSDVKNNHNTVLVDKQDDQGHIIYGPDGKPEQIEVNVASPEQIAAENNKGLISAVGASLAYDSTDHPVNPTKGFRTRGEAELAGLGGDHSFSVFSYLNSWYIPSGCKAVFKVRDDTKFIFPMFGTDYADIPLDERIFLGGIGSVRGFKDFNLGPKFIGTTTPKGGISMQLFSLEWLYRYNPMFEPFAYFDMGQLSTKTFNWGRYQTSAGVGLRANVMPGSPPLVVGYGWPIQVAPENREDTKNFFFSLGGTF
jgi:outer membrane protein insertion porin family